MYYIYNHVKKDTKDPFYVGKGKGNRCFKTRGRNPYWQRVADKHGFEVNIVASNIDEELSFLVEAECIDLYRRIGYQLVNMTDGGEGASGYKHTEAHRQSMIGNDYWKNMKSNGFKGKTHSDEQKKKWSETRKGVVSPRKGIQLSEETKNKMRTSKIGKPLIANRCLEDDQVREIRVLLKTQTIAAIARKFSVGESTIRRIRDGERYGDVQ